MKKTTLRSQPVTTVDAKQTGMHLNGHTNASRRGLLLLSALNSNTASPSSPAHRASRSVSRTKSSQISDLVYETYDEVRQLSTVGGGPVTPVVMVLGRSSAHDGGAGLYIWQDSTEPPLEQETVGGQVLWYSGAVLRPADNGPGYWERLHDGVFNIDWFRKEEITNLTHHNELDWQALQAAIRWVEKLGGGVVVGSAGKTYSLEGDVTITASNVMLDGRGASIKSTNDARLSISGTPTAHITNVSVQNWDFAANFSGLTFTYCSDCRAENITKHGATSANAFVLNKSDRCTLKNITTYGGAAQSILFSLISCNDCTLRSCHVRGSEGSTAFKNSGSSHNAIFDGCTVEGLNGTATVSAGFVEKSHGTTYRHCHFRGQPSVNKNAWLIQQFTFCTLVDCTVSHGRVSVVKTNGGLEEGITLRNVSVDASHLSGVQIRSIDPSGIAGVTITGGRFSNNQRDGILIDNAQRPLVDGVECRSNSICCGYSGLAIVSSDQPTVRNCICFDDNNAVPRQRYGIEIADDCTWPLVVDCQAYNNLIQNIFSHVPGTYRGNRPGDATLRTDDAIETYVADLTRSAGDGTVLMRVTVLGRDRSTNPQTSAKELVGLFKFSNGIPSLIGAITETTIQSPSIPWTNTGNLVTPNASEPGVLGIAIKVGGLDGVTIDWTVFFDCQLLDA